MSAAYCCRTASLLLSCQPDAPLDLVFSCQHSNFYKHVLSCAIIPHARQAHEQKQAEGGGMLPFALFVLVGSKSTNVHGRWVCQAWRQPAAA